MFFRIYGLKIKRKMYIYFQRGPGFFSHLIHLILFFDLRGRMFYLKESILYHFGSCIHLFPLYLATSTRLGCYLLQIISSLFFKQTSISLILISTLQCACACVYPSQLCGLSRIASWFRRTTGCGGRQIRRENTLAIGYGTIMCTTTLVPIWMIIALPPCPFFVPHTTSTTFALKLGLTPSGPNGRGILLLGSTDAFIGSTSP